VRSVVERYSCAILFFIFIILDECESRRAGGLGEYVECLGCRNKAAKVIRRNASAN
jgi:hypothetical protein